MCNAPQKGIMLVFDRYSFSLKQAILQCRKPSKERRISMAQDILEGVAWMHALSYAHTKLSLDHCLCQVTYPLLVKIGFP